MRLGIGDEIGNALDRQRWVNFEDQGIEIDAANRRQVAGKTKIQARVQHPVDDIRVGQQQERVTVRWRVDDRLGGYLLAGGTPVFNDERLAEPLRQHLTGQARDNIGRAARWKTDQQADRPRRIIFGAAAADKSRQR